MANWMTKYRFCGGIETTASGKLIYLILTDLCDTNGEITIPQRRLSEALGISKATVSRSLRRLEQVGRLRIMERYNDYGGRAPNKYVLK